LEFRVLGPVEAAVDDRPLPLGAKKQRAVLAMLALEANRPVSSDRLAEGLWGESPPRSAPKMVQLYVSQLRKALSGHDAEIVTRGGGYQLSCPDDAVDLARAERLVAAAANGGGADGEARAALALWRGQALADVADEPFAAAEIRRCEELWLQARELAIDADLAAGRLDEALRELPELAVEHPLREHLQA
jgi:DNA-binding SARP family transcriptional activator